MHWWNGLIPRLVCWLKLNRASHKWNKNNNEANTLKSLLGSLFFFFFFFKPKRKNIPPVENAERISTWQPPTDTHTHTHSQALYFKPQSSTKAFPDALKSVSPWQIVPSKRSWDKILFICISKKSCNELFSFAGEAKICCSVQCDHAETS